MSLGLVLFVIVSDMPYTPEQTQLLTGPITSAIQQAKPAVLIHLGDFKAGNLSCTDALLTASRDQIAGLYPLKVVYTPGDNDWTDCDRKTLSPRFDELERLRLIRRQFFQDKTGQAMTQHLPGLSRQANFIENAHWWLDKVAFATLHIPGTNNGRAEILRSSRTQALAEAERRDRANEVWLQQHFEQAKAQHAEAVVLAFQADIYHPDLKQPSRACTPQHPTACDGYQRIRTQIEYQAAQFYPKPVLLVHGDTSAFCLQQPALGLAPNLWRLNAGGDYTVLDAVQVRVDPAHPTQPFTATALQTGLTPPAICTYPPE